MITTNTITNTNTTCSGLISGTVVITNYITPIKLCYCNVPKSCGNQGWICSRCQKSNAPTEKSCDCAPQGCYPYVPYTSYIPCPVVPTTPYDWWANPLITAVPIYHTEPITYMTTTTTY